MFDFIPFLQLLALIIDERFRVGNTRDIYLICQRTLFLLVFAIARTITVSRSILTSKQTLEEIDERLKCPAIIGTFAFDPRQ